MALHEPRKLDTTPVSGQSQCAFLSKLPAELRNTVYRHVFTLSPAEPRPKSAHPLSLLLTCRQINHEATILAFQVHGFHIALTAAPTFVLLRDSVLHLSTQQTSAITTLLYDVGTGDIMKSRAAVEVIANSVPIFQSLQCFELRARRSAKLDSATLAKSAPSWFYQRILVPFITGRSFSWQEGEHWSLHWPRPDSGEPFTLDKYGTPRNMCKNRSMDNDIVNQISGLPIRQCGCGNVCWLSAILVQESGRTLTVDAIFSEPEDSLQEYDPPMYPPLKVKLIPGTEPSIETKTIPQINFGGVQVTGFAFDADDDYWKGLRRRNGTFGSALRGFVSDIHYYVKSFFY